MIENKCSSLRRSIFPEGVTGLFIYQALQSAGFQFLTSLLILYLIGPAHFSLQGAYLLEGNFQTLLGILPGVFFIALTRHMSYWTAIVISNILASCALVLLIFHAVLVLSLVLLILSACLSAPTYLLLLGNLFSCHSNYRKNTFLWSDAFSSLGILVVSPLFYFAHDEIGYRLLFIFAAVLLCVSTLPLIKYKDIYIDKCANSRSVTWSSRSYSMIINAICLFLVYTLLTHHAFVLFLLFIAWLYFLIRYYKDIKAKENKHFLQFFFLSFVNLIFAILAFIVITFVTVFIKYNVSHTFFFHNIPTSEIIAVYPIITCFILFFIANLLARLLKKYGNISLSLQFLLGFIACCVALFELFFCVHFTHNGLVAIKWIIIFYMFFATAWSLIAPASNALVHEFLPVSLRKRYMSFYLLMIGTAAYTSAYLNRYFSQGLSSTLKHLSRERYAHAFLLYAVISAIVCICLFAYWIYPRIKRRAIMSRAAG